MVMSMKVLGIMIWQMEKEIIFIVVEQNMKANGRKTYKTVKELKYGQVIFYLIFKR